MSVPASHTLAEVVDAGWAPSVLFLLRRLRKGEIKGRKVGREWRMTDADVQAYIEGLANRGESRASEAAAGSEPARIGLSAASIRRRAAS